MEMIVFLALLIPIACIVAFVVALNAMSRASRASESAEELRQRISRLEAELRQFRRESAKPAQPAAAPKPAPATETVVAPQTPVVPPVTEFKEIPIPEPPIIPPLPEPAPAPIVPPPIKREPSPAPLAFVEKISAPPKIEPQAESIPLSPPVVEKESIEMRLGTYWLVRVGIVMLLTGLAFFGNYAYHHIVGMFGAIGKISMMYAASGLLLGAGAWWQRHGTKESLKNYAQVLFAGGLAAVYFTTYAAHHIPPLRVIGSAELDGILLMLWAGVIAWIADRHKSEVMAMFAVGLAFYSSVITVVGEFTLYSNLILTITALVFLVRNRWAMLSFASLATTYAGYFFWRFLQGDRWREEPARIGHFLSQFLNISDWHERTAPVEYLALGAGFLISYWLVFTAATFLSKSEKLSGAGRAAFLTLNNGIFFALFLLTMLQSDSGGYWKFFLIYGAVLTGLAGLAKGILPKEPLAKNAYLTQGLLLVTLGFITKFAGLHLSLVLGVESVMLFMLGRQRKNAVLKGFGYAVAALACGWCSCSLKSFDQEGLWSGAALGLMMIVNTFMAHRENGSPSAMRPGPALFTVYALTTWFMTTWFNTTPEHLPLVLATETVAFTASYYLLRVRELVILGQTFLLLAQGTWLYQFQGHTPPWWNPVALIVITLGLSHWWQKQKLLVLNEKFGLGCQAIFAIALVALGLVWCHPLVDAPTWLFLTGALAVGATVYGIATRAWFIAVFGQIFLLASAMEFFKQVWTSKPDWYFPLTPIAVFVLLPLVTLTYFARKPDSPAVVRGTLLKIAMVYRWTAVVMSLCWLWQYLPSHEHVWAFMATGAAIFALGIWRKNLEALCAVVVYMVASLTILWTGENLEMDLYWANLLSVLAIFVMQQILRRKAGSLVTEEKIHGAIVFVAGLTLWRFLSCWAVTLAEGFSVTIIWVGFAVVMFAAGMMLRERFHRWFGLGVLAAAVGRVVFVDVWKQETIYRVLTFMALGVALLLVGFIYNKFQEKIREWL